MYQDFYKLRGKPFQLMPDIRFVFPSSGHKRALSYLLYGLEQREGFVVITGNVGTGKTLLIQALQKELSGRRMLTATMASANLDAADVIPSVAVAFGLTIDGRSKVQLLEELKRELSLSFRQGEGGLLVVDEAQTLTPAALEELRILSNVAIGGRALLQIFLVGQTELLLTMQRQHMEQLKQRVIAWYRLEPLSVEETRDYIIHRLRAAGWQNVPRFALDVFALVHEWSGGIPRRINILMDRVLLFGYLEGLSSIDRSRMQVVVDEMNEEMGVNMTPETSARADVAPTSEVTQNRSALESHGKMLPVEDRIEALDRKIDYLLRGLAGQGSAVIYDKQKTTTSSRAKATQKVTGGRAQKRKARKSRS